MNQIKPRLPNRNLSIDREILEVVQVLPVASFEGVLKGLVGKLLIWRRALGVDREPGCMVMVPANDNGRIGPHPLDYFMRIWSVIDKIADTPQLIVLAFRERLKRCDVCMDVGNDDDLHRNSVSGATKSSRQFTVDSGSVGVGWMSRRLPDASSSGVIIRPSQPNKERKEQQFRRTPSPFAPMAPDARIRIPDSGISRLAKSESRAAPKILASTAKMEMPAEAQRPTLRAGREDMRE